MTDPLSLALVHRNALSFRFPDTDTLLPPGGDTVTRVGDPLPCAVARAPCVSQSGLLACIDDYLTDDGNCGRQPTSGPFPHFTALPAANDAQADCIDTVPPCSPTAPEVRVAVDAASSLLARTRQCFTLRGASARAHVRCRICALRGIDLEQLPK